MDSLGGYRLLRTIGVGSRAEVFLAHPLRPDADGPPAVMKVYGPAVRDESIAAEIEALSRASGAHVVRVIDVTSTPEGAHALILSRHAAGTLARLLADRGHLVAGEAITVLAPLATALRRMHAAGVAHGSIGPGSVLFDAAGSPALACFGRATLFPPGLHAAALDTEQAVLADVVAFGALAGGLLDGAGAASLAHRARTEAAPGDWLDRFADALFDLADPLPVDLRPRAEVEYVAFPARVISAEPSPLPDSPVAVPTWRQWAARTRAALGRVRRPVWVVAAASIAALAVALMVVPQRSTSATAQPSSLPTPPAQSPTSTAVTGDDPVAAALVLLDARDLCIRDLSIECLDDVGQRDSSALDSDRSLLRSVIEGESAAAVIDVDPAVVVLTQRLGDSALVSLGPDSEPASLLLVKGEAGWRIRDYLEE